MIKLEWNVYYHNFNRDEIMKYNIFNHGGFLKYFEKIRKEYKKSEDKESFAERVKRELFYYYNSKCEWEIIITKKDDEIILTPWCGSRNNPELNVTNESDFNWTGFYDEIAEKRINYNKSIKIDVYEQVMYKWSEFVDYCWKECKRDRRKK